MEYEVVVCGNGNEVVIKRCLALDEKDAITDFMADIAAGKYKVVARRKVPTKAKKTSYFDFELSDVYDIVGEAIKSVQDVCTCGSGLKLRQSRDAWFRVEDCIRRTIDRYGEEAARRLEDRIHQDEAA